LTPRLFCLVAIFKVESKELELELELSANLFTCKGTYMTDWVVRGELAKPLLAGLQWQRKLVWLGAVACVLCTGLTLYDTSYSAQKSKPQHSDVTGAHASESALCVLSPGRTGMLARAMGITRVEDLPDRDHTVWEVKEPATAKQPTWLLML